MSKRVIVNSLALSWRQLFALPQTLILFVTSRCNARCEFCLYADQVANPVKKALELSVSEYEKIASSYGPLHYLALSGGEPFIRKDIAEICQCFIDQCGVSVIDIPSNFYYTDSMVESLTKLLSANPEVIVDLQLSLDDVGLAHDRSRKVDGLYDRARSTFEALVLLRNQFSNLRVKINVVFLDSNKDRLGDIFHKISDAFSFDRLSLTFPHKRLDPNLTDTALVSDFRAFKEATALIDEHPSNSRDFDLYSVGMRGANKSYIKIIEDSISGSKNMGAVCNAGKYILVIDEVGKVYPCEILWKTIGNLRDNDYSIPKVLHSNAYEEFAKDHLGPDKCNCTWSCAALSALSVNPLYLPEIAINGLRRSVPKK